MRLSSLAAAAAVFLLAPAGAQAAVTFNGICASTATAQQAACTASNGTYGNSVTIQAVDDATLKLRITAWQANQATTGADAGKVTTAFLGAYGGSNGNGGFGVTGIQDVDANGVKGGGATHQIDNVAGYTDFVMLQFSRAVHLEGFGLNLYSPFTDSDASIWNGSILTPSGPWNTAIDLTTVGTLDPTLWSNTAGGSTSGYRSATYGNAKSATANQGFSQVWLVAASTQTTDRNDGFKLSQILVLPQVIATPEPATWAMMIVGFGGIGASLRRRRTTGATQAA